MTKPNLAKIERVDLREAWPNEAQDFTPWLADNIAELGEALGMDLGEPQTEVPVGSFKLDILATNLGSKRYVIIENQLDETDHDHLGKLLTYAAGYDAETIVWIAKTFRDAHRQALEWLNQRTGVDTRCFGVVLELFQLDDGRLAPYFYPVVTPNEWAKVRKKAAPPSPSNTNPFPLCLCGCEDLNNPGSKFRPGHDAKLKSLLSKAKDGTLDSHSRLDILLEAFQRHPNLKVVKHVAEDVRKIIGKDKLSDPEFKRTEEEESPPNIPNLSSNVDEFDLTVEPEP